MEKSDWIEWDGGECPVDDETGIQVMFRDQTTYSSTTGGFRWKHIGTPGDIVAYRVAEDGEYDPPVAILGAKTVDVGEPVQEDIGSAATSKHYNSKLIQPIEICQMVLTPEEFQGAMKFNIMKYTQRAGSKEGESSQKDWNKALQYKLWLELAKQYKTIDPRKDIL